MTGTTARPDKLRLLIVDRRGWIARSLAHVLEASGWSVAHAHGGQEAREFVRGPTPHAILLHDDVTDVDVMELCRSLRAAPGVGFATPIVVVSTNVMRDRRVEALRAGATDYYIFPLDPEPFLLRLRALSLARREVESLERAALVDPDTGLYNAIGLARRALEIGADASRRGAALSCVVFAPLPLRRASPDAPAPRAAEIGEVIRRTGRLSDTIGRLDDVLVVIAPATGQPGAQRLAERLHRALDDDAPRVRAAYCTAADFAKAQIEVPQMIERALGALAATTEPPIVGESIPIE